VLLALAERKVRAHTVATSEGDKLTIHEEDTTNWRLGFISFCYIGVVE
jgi:hypothetical protein